jgi:hypothetical protein
LPANGMRAEDAGIDVEQFFHGEHLGIGL